MTHMHLADVALSPHTLRRRLQGGRCVHDDQEPTESKERPGVEAKAAVQSGTARTVAGSKVVGGKVADASGTAARRAAERARVVQPRIRQVAETTADQAARAAALASERARRRMPRHGDGEPIREAILDLEERPRPLLPGAPRDLSAALLASQFLLADFITSREQDEQRWRKKERVLDRQRLALREVGIPEEQAASVVRAFGSTLAVTERIAFLVDLYFLDPFAPYTLKSAEEPRTDALERLAVLVGGEAADVARIRDTRRSAVKSHTKRSLGKIGLIGIGAAVALGVAGFLAAPLVGAAIGGAAGLGGAAAVSHGLAILGGGALAAGGAGMAGGMWLVAGVGAAAGLLAAGGGTALYELGSATARGELVKLQITFKLGLLDANRDMAKAQQAIVNLVAQADATRAILDEERKLNDENARRVKDLEATLTAIEETIVWMDQQREQAEANG